MDTLWSMSTTLRNGERLIGFLKTLMQIDGEEWSFETQKKLQILLIKDRRYLNTGNTQSLSGLSDKQQELLLDLDKQMTYKEAEDIFNTKNYLDPAMRGRQSMSPLKKLGLAYIVNNKVRVTDVGKKLANNEVDFGEFMLDSLLKMQYPNRNDEGFNDWNTKPFINTLRLIKRVNELSGTNAKGITKLEFGIFALSLKKYNQVDIVAEEIIKFRNTYNKTPIKEQNQFVNKYIESYLKDFRNATFHNTQEYTDNMIRYLRLTKYIFIRGKYNHIYIDLEPRRQIEINSILDNDDGQAKDFSVEEWQRYMGTFGSYELPFETIPMLVNIANKIIVEINDIKKTLQDSKLLPIVSSTDKNSLKNKIKELRLERTRLQNILVKVEVHKDTAQIQDTINGLEDLVSHRSNGNKFSVELERLANISLNILDDALLIKPNAPIGDDNEPTYTAPSGVADIECYYDSFNSICEVTMLTGRDQWHNEGQPVMRHLRQFENQYENKPSFCLFIAPKLHIDTINTFWISNRYEYMGKRQQIVPITIRQLIYILNFVKTKIDNGKRFTHTALENLFTEIVNVNTINNSSEWLNGIQGKIENWAQAC